MQSQVSWARIANVQAHNAGFTCFWDQGVRLEEFAVSRVNNLFELRHEDLLG